MSAVNSLAPLLPPLRRGEEERALSLRELRCFHSVARTGNLGRSARELNISQPAMSQQMRKLEEGFGTQLLVRHGRGVMLTKAGACLRDRLDTIMQLLAKPLEENAPGSGRRASLSLAVGAETGPLIAAALATKVRACWPDVALEIREGSDTELAEWVLDHRVDVAAMHDPPSLSALHITPVLTEKLGLIAPVRSSLAEDMRPLRLSDLLDAALILPSGQHWIRRTVQRAAQRHGLRLEATLEVNSVAATKAMVRNGLACTILPRAAVQDELARGVLCFRPIAHPELISLSAVVCRSPASAPVVAEFVELARAAMTELACSGQWPHVDLVKPARRDVVLLGVHQPDRDSSETAAGRVTSQ
jgi:LysR family nitrogen assimilation transcriptional regulator